MPVIIGIHLRAPIIKKGCCNLGNKCAFKHTEQPGGRHSSRFAYGKSEGSFCVWCVRYSSDLFCIRLVRKLSSVYLLASRHVLFTRARRKATLLGIAKHGGESNALSHEQLECCAELTESNI